MSEARLEPRFSRLILAVLAGGRSSRFGSSKIALSWRGVPLLAAQRARLAGFASADPDFSQLPVETWLNLPMEASMPGPPPGAEGYDRVVRDAEPFAGPLAGLLAVLTAARDGDLVAAVPADMPLIQPHHLQSLINPFRGDPPPAMAFARVGGRIEPLPSVYHAGRARGIVAAAKAANAGPIKLSNHPEAASVAFPAADADAWRSINTPEDWARLSSAGGPDM